MNGEARLASAEVRIPWHPIEGLPSTAVPRNGGLAALDALRNEWERFLAQLSEPERIAIRQRSLRRLAIETGILERLYDIDWGLTLTLVAEGFARDVIERSQGRIEDRTRATLEAQRDGLQMVLDFVSSGRNLSAGFIRELHAAITRTQDTYVVTDALGRITEAPLPRGTWKMQPNHVALPDGRILEYTPPEQVASEIDRLIELYGEFERGRMHPIAIAAWLHHRFVQIHPFADGNGRVARALVLLVLQRGRYAPLVVDRFHRDEYLKALDRANAGDLASLIRLFVRLESAALASELEAPLLETAPGVSSNVAHTLAAQLRAAREKHTLEVQREIHVRALAIAARIRRWFETKTEELQDTFQSQQLEDARFLNDFQFGEGAPRRYWFRRQTIEAARAAGHYADFGPDSGWCGLRIKLGGFVLRYVAALHGAGQRSGVLAVVTFGEIELRDEDEGSERREDRQGVQTTADAFRVVHTEPVEAIDQRSDELEDLLDEGLSIALVSLFRMAR